MFSIKYEAHCLEKVFKALIEDFEEMKIKKFMISTKRNVHFIARVAKVVSEKVSPDIKVKSKSNYHIKL